MTNGNITMGSGEDECNEKKVYKYSEIRSLKVHKYFRQTKQLVGNINCEGSTTKVKA